MSGDFNDVLEYANDVISHHGVKGQKWGVRNGPPYPLKPSSKGKGSGEKSENNRTSKNRKDGLIVEAVATAAVSAFAISKIIKSIREKRQLEKALKKSNADNRKEQRENEKIDPKTGLYLKNGKSTMEEDMANINPNYDAGGPFQTNCTFCTAAMELRARGYDVCAGSEKTCTGIERGESGKFFGTGSDKEYELYSFDNTSQKPGEYEKALKEYKNKIVDGIKKQGNGARGEFIASWIGGAGHSMYYTVDNGKVTIWDTQRNTKLSDSEFQDMLGSTEAVDVKRLDDKPMNLEALKKHNAIV